MSAERNRPGETSLPDEVYHARIVSWEPHPHIAGYRWVNLRDDPALMPDASDEEWYFTMPVVETDLHVGDAFTVYRERFLVHEPDGEVWECSFMSAWRLRDGPRIAVDPLLIGDQYM